LSEHLLPVAGGALIKVSILFIYLLKPPQFEVYSRSEEPAAACWPLPQADCEQFALSTELES
jgi:hypothetical protein